jgi:hypothetical protein
MITVSRTTSPVDAVSNAGATAAPSDAAGQAAEAAPAFPAADPLAAFSAVHGLHKDVQGLAEPRHGEAADAQGTPLYDRKDAQGAGRKETPRAACLAPAKSFDLNSPTIVDDIKELKRCGHAKLAFTIEQARRSYKDLLERTPPAQIFVTTSAGNGGQPVLVIAGPEFKRSDPAHVHTYYHGDNATVADPLGSKDGHNARIRAVITGEDKQAVFVLPESEASKLAVDSPSNNLEYSVTWFNVSNQAQTTNDALAAANITKVGRCTVEAHSGGGMALVQAITSVPDGKGLQADRIVLLDCVYHFGEPRRHDFHTDEHLRDWAQTANGKAVKDVVFIRGSNQDFEQRGKVIGDAFPTATGQPQRFHLKDLSDPKQAPPVVKDGKIDVSIDPIATDSNGKAVGKNVHNYEPGAKNHYRTAGQFLGADPIR